MQGAPLGPVPPDPGVDDTGLAPQVTAGPDRRDEDRWHELLDALAREVPSLARQFVGRVHGVLGYADAASLVDDDELARTASACIALLIDGIREGRIDRRLEALAHELGSRRAAQQVPAEALATAVQLDFSVIWGRMLELCEPGDATLLTAHVEQIWRTVDAFAAATMAAYTHEVTRLSQRYLDRRHSTLVRLFASTRPPNAAVRAVAHELGVDAEARLTVAVADEPAGQDALVAAVARVRGQAACTHRTGGVLVAFWAGGVRPEPVSTPPRAPDARTPRTAAPDTGASGGATESGSPIRVARWRDVLGIAAVPAAARTLTGLLEATDPTEQAVIDLESRVPEIARRALVADDVDLDAVIEARLDACSDAERDRLAETVRTYLGTGSVQATASALYCHRNTVRGRLGRFTELTGLDLTVPRDAATTLIAWG